MPDWFPLYSAVEAFGRMNCSVHPWDLAKRPECWAVWAIDYEQAKQAAVVMRAQIDEARAKGQT